MTKFVKSNEAVVMGALYAGCELYFGYPITPASEIAHGAAKWFPMLGRTFVQAECETASVNMMFGAAAAGKLCMTATSGPGFSLMQEGISYLAGAELPAVIVNVNRAGPGLGNVYPEQSDYTPAVKGGGHGNYRTFTVAPASAQEMFDLTRLAFRMAAKWRTPAVVFADGLQGQMMESVRLPDEEDPKPDFSGWAAQGEPKTRGNLVKSIFLDAAQQEEFNLHLQKKYADMEADAKSEAYLAEDAELLIVAYGISSRIARTTAETLRAEGIKAGCFRPITLSPFPMRGLERVAKGRKLLVIALDAGQFADDVRLNLAKAGLGNEAASLRLINRMGGQVVAVDDAVKAAKRVLA
ncbi:MAG: 3-methyl-2-oxobutanoate dehydrogenase subunit VorB [Verrucomicrobiota bacterium]|nr:3-methyl-2-oxobutanoate dehydrogenase subunit VorB [Verrucomicrobiota bacterium]MDY5596360.1 3-methyl-2-oxobutanoate dehydrogenase subunit VorB [Kiritimatiellia bacterium]